MEEFFITWVPKPWMGPSNIVLSCVLWCSEDFRGSVGDLKKTKWETTTLVKPGSCLMGCPSLSTDKTLGGIQKTEKQEDH